MELASREAVADQTEVSVRLAKHVWLTEAEGTRNLVFSPPLIHLVLSVIAAGSTGLTRDQLLSFLRSKSSDHLNKLSSDLAAVVFTDGTSAGGPELNFANALWFDQSLPLKPTFKYLVENVYQAGVNQADFINKAAEVTPEVNSWAEKETKGIIKEVLPLGSVDNTTRLIFASAIYFKGAWQHEFDTSLIEEGYFHLHNGGAVKVPFMTSKEPQFIREFDGFKVLRLKYESGKDKRSFSMYFYLPDAQDGLHALVEEISCQPSFLDQHSPFIPVQVGVFRLPKFKISFGFEASNVLKGLGVELPFSEIGSEITEMVEAKLHVSRIYHKSFIEVDEKGTKVAGAGAIELLFRSADKSDFVADHPFMFLIREDETGVVLFIGHVMNPLEN